MADNITRLEHPLPEPADGGDGTLAMAALDQIVELIKRHELKPGGIVNESDLAKRFGMSRGPVREAVRRLEGRKLVVREAYQRARLAPLELNDIREIFEVREALEGMACRLAAVRMSEAALGDLLRQVEASRQPGSEAAYFTEEYKFNFHVAIVSACGNPRLQSILTAEVYDLIRLYRWASNAIPGRDGKAPQEHWQIARAMATRDAELAESLMRAHVQRSMQLLSAG